jgi:drug/metabolite transporter (DMT)-like permease
MLLALMVLLWSFSFVLVDIAIEFIPPLSIALNRYLIVSISFLIIDLFLFIKKKKIIQLNFKTNNNEKYSKKDWINLLISSFCGISVFFLVQYSAIALIGPSLPALFVCLLAPVIITSLALFFFNEKLTKVKILGFIIATIGGFLLITGGDMRKLTPETPNFLGYLFALITPLLWAIYSIITKKIGKSKSNLKILKTISYLGTIELFIFVLINNEFLLFIQNILNPLVILSGLYLGIGCYIIGYYIWQKSQKELISSKGASFLYIEPFITLLFSYLLNRSEIIVFWNVFGGCIVLISLFLINY